MPVPRQNVQWTFGAPTIGTSVDVGTFANNAVFNLPVHFHNHNSNNARTKKDYYLPLAIQSAFWKLNVSHVVTFHLTNQWAKDFLSLAEQFFARNDDNNTNDFNVDLFHMDHKTPPARRREILRQARESSRSIITNCKLLSMGVDEAWLDLVVIADPVRSTIDGRQMIGRVGRKAPGKKRGYVVVPVPVGNNNGNGNGINGRAYQRFVTTFAHMVHLDEALRQDVLVVVEKSAELGRPLLESEYPPQVLEAFNLPASIPVEWKHQLMDGAIVAYNNDDDNDDSSRVWDRMFELLARYKKEQKGGANTNYCSVPQNYRDKGGEPLGAWLNTQRLNKRRGLLDPRREDRLTKLGVAWDPNAQQWEDAYGLLVQYKERFGDCNVPRNYQHQQKDGGNDTNSNNNNLGHWLTRQRLSKKKGTLDPALENRLTELGVVWDLLGRQWGSMHALLLRYKEREGDCNVPFVHQEGGEQLGMWLNTQRHNKKNGDLDTDRIEQLESAGIVWDVLGRQWEGMHALLCAYQKRTGNCNVPLAHREDGKNLGSWLTKQRRDKKTGALGAKKEDALEALGVVWNPTAQQWNSTYELLVQFKEREGHCNVPQGHRENLGMWLVNQRTNKRTGKLDAGLEKALADLGVVWDLTAQQWSGMYTLLVRYKERNGDCNVPRGHREEGKNLGNWANTQRTSEKNGKLSKERIQRLEDLGFLWNTTNR